MATTDTLPVPAGVTAVQVVVLGQRTLVAAVPPNKNVVLLTAVSKPVPVMVTVVPPAAVPVLGEIELSDGM
jgi:hypothetical protein